MTRTFITCLFLIAIMLTSCLNSEKYENASRFYLNDFKLISKLNAATIEFDEPIMMPLSFVKSDSLLIVQNIRTNKLLYVYNMNTRKKVGEFISRGSGPDDLLNIKDMQLVDFDLFITDNLKRAIYKYDIASFHALTDNIIPTQRIAIDEYFFHLAYIGNGYVATAMNPDNKRLVFYNSNGKIEFTAGDYPYFGRELTNIEKMESFNNSFIAICQKHKRIYLFGMTTDLIEIYDFNGVLIKKLHGPEQIFPQVKEIRSSDGASRISALEKSIFTFSRPQIIDDEIYVAYSGERYIIDEERVPIHHILVFDMDCKPLRRYELSKSIVAFTVDSETKTIYATSNVPEYHIVVFEQ